MSAVLFPQPAVVAPAHKCPYFYTHRGEVYSDTWGTVSAPQGVDAELEALARGEIYLSKAEADLRIAYDAQEMARLVIPAWIRAMGPDVEYQWSPGRWASNNSWSIDDWSLQKPADFRAKPKAAPDVVHVLDGVEYRWPATVKQSDPCGDRYTAMAEAGVVKECNTGRYRLRTHHTRAGADAQNAMLTAALGAGS